MIYFATKLKHLEPSPTLSLCTSAAVPGAQINKQYTSDDLFCEQINKKWKTNHQIIYFANIETYPIW